MNNIEQEKRGHRWFSLVSLKGGSDAAKKLLVKDGARKDGVDESVPSSLGLSGRLLRSLERRSSSDKKPVAAPADRPKTPVQPTEGRGRWSPKAFFSVIQTKLPSIKTATGESARMAKIKAEVKAAEFSYFRRFSSFATMSPEDAMKTKTAGKRRIRWGGRFSTKDLVHFIKRLAFLIKSGVPIIDSISLLRKQTRGRGKGVMLDDIIEGVENGRFLSDGMAKYRDNFGGFAVNVVRIGEMSGGLSQNLTYLADELEKRHMLQKKLIGALVYPAFITLATIAVSVMLTVYIFPKVMPIFASLNVDLPWTTLVLLFVSNFLRDFGLYLLLAIIVAVIAFIVVMKKWKAFNYYVSLTILKLPLIGALVKNYNMANFCRTWSLLLKSGFGVVEACTINSDSTSNPVYKEESLRLRERIVRGEKISKYLEENPRLFPDIVRHMVAIGESSGTLSDTLLYLSEHYESEVDDLIKNLSNSIEPVLMIFMGLVVGFVAVSVITPIYEVTQHLSK